MKLIILGSGTFQPELNKHGSAYLVKLRNQNLVFDFGRGTLDQLMKNGIDYCNVDSIFISHVHADHCSELISLLHVLLSLAWTNFPQPKKEKLKNKKLRVYGPKGIKKTVGYMLKAFLLDKSKNVRKIKVKELSNKEIVKGKNWTVKCFSVEHLKMNNIAYKLKAEDKILVYGGDGKDCKGLREACTNADLAILDSTLPTHFKSCGHNSAEDAGRIAEESGVKKLVLTHISPSYFKSDIKKEVRRSYKGKVIIAKDLMKIKI